ncbi:MAG TPA: Hsp33 family molecular chaperone HslO [Vicinamibacteria bacterium]|nr:Hsp33 family molecular chaperone HslO [Vicinamibacteria bacterium]
MAGRPESPRTAGHGEKDALQRFIFERARVRGELVRLDETWREVSRRRDYPEPVLSALGELTAASVLMAATVKFEGGELVLQIQGGHPVSLLVVECQADLSLRAMARWGGGLPEPGPQTTLHDLARGGRCALTLDPGPRLTAYQGVVSLEGRTTAQVLERYMARSEQIGTLFRLAATGERAAGLLLQRLPDAGGKPVPDADPDLWNRVGHLAATLTRQELLQLPGRQILRRLFHEEELRLFESVPVRFACRCSRERVAGVLRMVGREEVAHALAEKGELTVTCEFCGQSYTFTREQAERALADASGRTPERAG